MHLVAIVCCIGCLALIGATQNDINTRETGQILLTLKETHNEKYVQKRQVPLYPLMDVGWYPDANFGHQPSGQRLQYFGVPPQYQRFVNETLSRVPSGFCQKEVP